jgi:hypothetical protein
MDNVYLQHVVCVLPDTVGEAETLEYFKGTALDTICLSSEDLSVSLLDKADLQTGESSEPCCGHVTGIAVSTVLLLSRNEWVSKSRK